MKLIPIVGLAAVMAAGLGSAAFAQTYSDPNYDQSARDYQSQSDTYQDQRNVYQNQQDAYAQRSDAYAAKRDAYERQRRAYERQRAAYDAQYGAGAYESYYGAYNPRENYGDRLNDMRGDNADGYDRGSQEYQGDGERPY
ncbi:MAG TPA: hypothetical protein VII73_01235 [Caulobacteraceae bacterium]